MAETYSVPTVAKYLVRGLFTVIFLVVCTFGILLVVVVFLISTDSSQEALERAEWCAEYMPEATDSECAAEAGW
jgi:hypothetical protein